jgi:hypothetical protein
MYVSSDQFSHLRAPTHSGLEVSTAREGQLEAMMRPAIVGCAMLALIVVTYDHLASRASPVVMTGYIWNGGEEYWAPTPLDVDQLKLRRQPISDGLQFSLSRPTLKQKGVNIDSWGAVESVDTSRPWKSNSFVVDEENAVHPTTRNIAMRHSGPDQPYHPREIPSDQFIGN